MPVSVYLLQSLKDSSFYVGISDDVKRRLSEHNLGKLKITSLKRPWNLAWYKEYPDYASARKHEKWLKKKNRKYKLYLTQLALGGVNYRSSAESADRRLT